MANEPTTAIDIILVGYDLGRTERALAFCHLAFGKMPVNAQVLVLNHPSLAVMHPADGWRCVAGSNGLGEFSGWQEGLAAIGATRSKGVLFLNDTLGAHRHLSIFRRWALRAELRRVDTAGFVGFTDESAKHTDGMSIKGFTLHGWVSSYCFFLTAQALRLLSGRLYDENEVDSCVPGGLEEEKFFSPALSPTLRQYLQWWLFKGWYRSAPLDDENLERVRMKARCICAELLLSARCVALGIDVRDPSRQHRVAHALDILNRHRVALFRTGK